MKNTDQSISRHLTKPCLLLCGGTENTTQRKQQTERLATFRFSFSFADARGYHSRFEAKSHSKMNRETENRCHASIDLAGQATEGK